MPATKSDLFTKQEAGSFNDRIDDKRKLEATILYATALITLVGDEVATNVIDVVRLPENAIVYPELCSVIAEDPGTTLTATVGDSADADRYSGTLTLSAGGVVPFIAANATSFPDGFVNRHKVNSATKDVKLTVASAATLSAGADIYVKIAYGSL